MEDELEWDPDDVGFFYPDMPSSWGTDELIDRDHSTYHRTAHSFVCFSVATRSTNIYSARTSRHVSKAKPILGGSTKIPSYNEA
jgi:hypothetical protein